mmetsp:Transcript_16218/g.29654  ORF Transcript_16218/g.29654 Transcript_16218/m.29654 type:complete len:309 (-) Transcript_16218:85-1011(-)
MLDCTRNAYANVELGSNDLTGLSDLHIIGNESSIDCSAARTNSSSHLICKVVEHLKVLAALHATAASNDGLSRGKLWPVALCNIVSYPGGEVGAAGSGNLLNGSRATFRACLVKAGHAHGSNLDSVGALDGRNSVSSVHGALERVLAKDLEHVRDNRHVELGAQPRSDVLSVVRSREENVAERFVCLNALQETGYVLCNTVRVNVILCAKHIGNAIHACSSRCSRVRSSTSHEHGYVAAKGLGGSDHAQSLIRELAVDVLAYNKRRGRARSRRHGHATAQSAEAHNRTRSEHLDCCRSKELLLPPTAF